MQHYHGALANALTLIDTRLRPLQDTDNYALQLHLINTCCYAALSSMIALMPWHANASQVFNHAAYNYQLVCIQEPLKLQQNSQLKVASQITAAWQEVNKANERTQQAEAAQHKQKEKKRMRKLKQLKQELK